MSTAFQKKPHFLGLESSPALIRDPEGKGCIKRFFCILKEQLLCVRHFHDLEELQLVLPEFRDCYNREWLIERPAFQFPRPARERLLAFGQAACLW